ncbi:MAG: C4-dicarboxylate ABC transporter substrate-binding protein [Proteobacteria bacterium]|nr:MAG: C4-dicarboxylate ABC transporter substrate-binding protein [Pseudomonadota bacterium]
MKKIILKGAIALVGSMALATGSMAKEKKTTLLVHHFLSSKSPAHTKFIVPWGKKLEKLSNGKIKVEVYPSMSMGGKPGELYKQVRDGSADIVWTVAGYTPGVFPRTEVYELPTVHIGDAVATNVAIRENFDLIKKDFKNIKPLLIHVHAGNALHTVDKKVTKVEDLKGLKLRTPSRVGAWHIKEMGAEPVGMPLPAFPQALSKKAIDGGFIPFEVFPPFKFQQLTRYSAEGVNGERFGTSVFLFLMNKKKFDNLSKELQDIITNSVNMDMLKEIGKVWMDVEKPGMKMQKESKNSEIVKISEKEMEKFNAVGQKVVDKWIKEASAKGIDAKKLVKTAREAIVKNTK